MTLPTGLRGRLVALALLFIPAILLVRFVVWPMVDTYFVAAEELEVTRDEITRYQRLLNELPTLQAAATRLERTSPLKPYLHAGDNAALAAAGLQRSLQDAAGKHDVTVLSLRVRSPDTEGPFELISVEARLRASAPQLRDLLYIIETSTPYLFVGDLSITVRHSGRRRRTKATTPGTLEVSLTLYGLRAPEAQQGKGITRG